MIDILCQTVVQAVAHLALPTTLVVGGIAWSERHG